MRVRFAAIALLVSWSATQGYDLVGPYNTGIDPVDYGVSADVGVRKDVDWGIDIGKGNYLGKPFERVCFYGHNATVFANAAKVNHPTVEVTFFDTTVTPDATQNQCFQTFPSGESSPMGIAAIIVTPGEYQGAQAKPFNPDNKTYPRIGEISYGGLAGYPRPTLDFLPSQAKLFANRQDGLFVHHLVTKGIGVAMSLDNAGVFGVAQSDYKQDCIKMTDPDDWYVANRRQYTQKNALGDPEKWVIDWESWNCGRGNATHGAYVEFVDAGIIYVDHVHSYGHNGSHAFKAPVTKIRLTNSILSVVPKIDEQAIRFGPYGTKLLDGMSCSQIYIDNVLFIGASGKVDNRSFVAEPMLLQARRPAPVMGCNKPFPYGQAPMNTAEFWQGVRDNTLPSSDPASPYFYHFIGNIGYHRIDLRDYGGSNSNKGFVVANAGTWWQEKGFKFSSWNIFNSFGAELDPLFVERAITVINPLNVKTNTRLSMPDCYQENDSQCTQYEPDVDTDNPIDTYLFVGNRNNPAFIGWDYDNPKTDGTYPPILGEAKDVVPIPDRVMKMYTGRDMVPAYLLAGTSDVPTSPPDPDEPPPVEEPSDPPPPEPEPWWSKVNVDKTATSYNKEAMRIDSMTIEITLPEGVEPPASTTLTIKRVAD